MRKEGKKNKGQILIESLVAISIGIVALTAFLTYLSQTLASTRIMNERAIAVYLAIEGLEVVKNILDTDYVEGNEWGDAFWFDDSPPNKNFMVWHGASRSDVIGPFNGPGFGSQIAPLRFNPATGIYNYDPSGIETIYRRAVTVRWTNISGPGEVFERMKVTSRVVWKEKKTGQDREISIESYFFDWRVEPED